MFNAPRRTATKVRNGRVQRKNRTAGTPNYVTHEMPTLVIDRKNPGAGYRHLVSKKQLRQFLHMLPEWDTLRLGLNAVVLDRGQEDTLGWHQPGVVALCAWERSIYLEDCCLGFIDEHQEIFDKLNVEYVRGHNTTIEFTLATARAFSLIHVLVHELGHHHDRMTTHSRKRACRGEAFAEAYARKHEDRILARYRNTFEL